MHRVAELLRWAAASHFMLAFVGAFSGVMLGFSLPSRMNTDRPPERTVPRGQSVPLETTAVPCRNMDLSVAGAPDGGDSACPHSQDPTPAAIPDIEPDSSPRCLEHLATRFRELCAECHGEDGKGNAVRMERPTIPDFTNVAWQVSRTEVAIVNQVADGTEPLMPAFRDKLSPGQILELAVYVRTFTARSTIDAGNPAPPPDPSGAAEGNFRAHCIECHDGDGRGKRSVREVAPTLPDFTSSDWQKSRSDAVLAHSIQEGKGALMPPMKDVLGTAEIQQMVALIRAFRDGRQTIAAEGPDASDPEAPADAGKRSGQDRLLPDEQHTQAAPEVRAGAGLFRRYCVACHAADGTGAAARAKLTRIPDFTKASWQKEHTDHALVVSILDGKGAQMPANRGRLSDAQARELVACIRSFGPRTMRKKRAAVSEFEKSFRELQERWNELEQETRRD
jgi:mono/diheme cytochrome c family protein